jgi:hypothetical protein
MPFRNMPRIGALACLEVKMIGKPYAGELHVRFDEGEQVFVARRILNGHEAGNGGDKPRIDLTNTEPVLYSTCRLQNCYQGNLLPIASTGQGH